MSTAMPMPRKKIWVPVVVIVAAIVVLFASSYWSLPSPDEARELATGAFERYAQQQKIDLRLFEGPRAREIAGAAYAFEWTYVDAEGKLTILIPVDRGGWTKVVFDVDDSYDGSQAAIDKLDRLIQRVKERSQGMG